MSRASRRDCALALWPICASQASPRGLPPGPDPFPGAHGGHLRWVARSSRLASDAPSLSLCSQVGEGHRVVPGLSQPNGHPKPKVCAQGRNRGRSARPPSLQAVSTSRRRCPLTPLIARSSIPSRRRSRAPAGVGRLGGVLGHVVGHCPGAGRWRLQGITPTTSSPRATCCCRLVMSRTSIWLPQRATSEKPAGKGTFTVDAANRIAGRQGWRHRP